MEPLQQNMDEFKHQLRRGYIQAAYQGLMQYLRDLRSHFRDRYHEYSLSSGIYYGYLDMTYFSLVPEELKALKLKIALVFVYDSFRFEIWLSGANRGVQRKYWKLIQDRGWKKYQLASNPTTEDYVIRHVLTEDPDFSDLDRLTKLIDEGSLVFIRDVGGFLKKQAGLVTSKTESR